MKIYGIRNGRELFGWLTNCVGKVELVDESGERILLTGGREKQSKLPMTCFDNEIQKMELLFEKAEDCIGMFSYIQCRRG